MDFVRHESDALIGGVQPISNLGVRTLHHLDIWKALNEHFPFWAVDTGARLGSWHPRMKEMVGLRYLHKQVTTMDRGRMKQWPTLGTKLGLVTVPITEAVGRADFPLVSMTQQDAINLDQGIYPEIREQETARVMKPRVVTVSKVGWAEVFYQVLAQHIPGLTPGWIAREFGVPMEWYAHARISPLVRAWEIAKKRGYG